MEKIYEAVKLIKETCANTKCRECPLFDYSDCIVAKDNSADFPPSEWELDKISRKEY